MCELTHLLYKAPRHYKTSELLANPPLHKKLPFLTIWKKSSLWIFLYAQSTAATTLFEDITYIHIRIWDALKRPDYDNGTHF